MLLPWQYALCMRYQKMSSQRAALRPREKMIEHGPRILRDDELLAIILATGIRSGHTKLSVDSLAKILIKDYGTRGLFGFSDANELAGATGLPPVKSCLLAAIGELMRRAGERDRAEISSAEDAIAYFEDLRIAKKELVRIACLSPENLVFYSEDAAIGDDSTVRCPLISVFHPPVRFYAQRMILAHNHPRGIAKPSKQDLAWHRELMATAQKLEIEVLDHIIIGQDSEYSFAEAGLC